MLSPHLAELYQVETRALVQAVKRHPDRFPKDFMFQLTSAECANLKSQIVISSWGGARRAAPYAFTELGVAMLSSVLNSERAVRMNMAIMRAFVKLRELIANNAELAGRLEKLEAGQRRHAMALSLLAKDIESLANHLKAPRDPKRHIGFITDGK